MAHNRDKYPEIWAQFEKAQKALKPFETKRAKETAKIDLVEAEIQALREKKSKLNDKAMADFEQIRELRDEIGRLAKAMGARSA